MPISGNAMMARPEYYDQLSLMGQRSAVRLPARYLSSALLPPGKDSVQSQAKFLMVLKVLEQYTADANGFIYFFGLASHT